MLTLRLKIVELNAEERKAEVILVRKLNSAVAVACLLAKIDIMDPSNTNMNYEYVIHVLTNKAERESYPVASELSREHVSN